MEASLHACSSTEHIILPVQKYAANYVYNREKFDHGLSIF